MALFQTLSNVVNAFKTRQDISLSSFLKYFLYQKDFKNFQDILEIFKNIKNIRVNHTVQSSDIEWASISNVLFCRYPNSKLMLSQWKWIFLITQYPCRIFWSLKIFEASKTQAVPIDAMLSLTCGSFTVLDTGLKPVLFFSLKTKIYHLEYYLPVGVAYKTSCIKTNV